MNGITLQSQAPAAGGADLGFYLKSQIVGQPMAMGERDLATLVEAIAANRFVLPRDKKTNARITEKGTAIVEVHGILINRSPVFGSFWGLTSYEGLTEQCRRLKTNSNVKRVVLDINSPGGMVTGCAACADALADLGKTKPLHAIAHDMAASAGYWLASVAKTISASRDAIVGSIGVRSGHLSFGEALEREGIAVTLFKAGQTKTDLNPYEALDPGAAAEEQYEIERAYDQFVAHVAKHRPLSEQEVRDTDARTWTGERAVEMKLADRVETLEDMIARLEKAAPKVATAKAAGAKKSPASTAQPSAGNTPRKLGANRMEETARSAEQGTVSSDIIAQIASAIEANKAAATPAEPAPPAEQKPATPSAADERKRVSAILTCDAGKALPQVAQYIATETDLGAEAAVGILEAVKADVDAKAEAAGDEGGDKAELNNALKTEMAKRGNSAGIKPDGAEGNSERPSLAQKVAAKYGQKKKGL